MTSAPHTAPARLAGVLLITSMTVMLAGAVTVVPSGLTLNPTDPAGVLAAVRAGVGLHLLALALDVIGWAALLGAALAVAARATATGAHLGLVPAGLLAAAALAGLLHDAGNLALTQLAGDVADPATAASVRAVLLTAKWTVNLAGLLWAAATVTAARWLPLPVGLRRAGALAALCGLAAVVLPWTTGTAGPSELLEQVGYALQLPVMAWFVVLGWRDLRTPA